MSDTVIYHNPACTTSRNTLALLREKGIEPTVVEYLKTGWTRDQLQGLLKAMGKRARGPAEEMGLTDPAVTDQALIAAMVEHPVLVERPIVVTPKGTVLCRPVDQVLTVL